MNTALPLKGVNLGGWLILERWMTPAVFAGSQAVDEYSLSQTAHGRAAIKKHRDTFITEADFVWLQKNKINIIRLPVGYWLFQSNESLLPHVSYVDWVMKMAHKYKIKVIIDLHGLMGSQNGNDHSGRIGNSNWFKHKSFRDETIATLEQIAKRYSHHPQLWAVQIINEPKFGVFHFKLRTFYKRAYATLSHILEPRTYIIFSDGFTPRLLSGALGQSRRVIMDVHLYHGVKPWTKYVSLQRYYKSLIRQAALIRRLSKTQPLIIGEWSGSLRQAEFDRLPIERHNDLVKEHVTKQIESFKYAKAWFYWNYKTEKPGVWDFRSQVDAGIISLAD